ncbi:MAG: hydroxymethylglutaryl-CoA lyase [Halieaceae bacterium]|jgi:hydroxymethylglutaryl-CoA lyase|nr:hydroxymethylglutaryl-CoA lyase [Halieaceae bacterium]
MKENVVVNDVGPRDGLQNQAQVLSPTQRLRLIQALLDAGVSHIEVGSFVSPKAVPAMAGTGEIVAGLPPGGAVYSALVPNRRGYELARDAGIKVVELVVATTDTMNLKNINADTATAMGAIADIVALARADGVQVMSYLATAWECPFEGLVDADVALALAQQMFDAGVDTVVLADSIGAADPGSVTALTERAVAQFGAERLACHFHDTRGMGVANVAAALECGVRRFDSSIGGLGGCPFAPGASGNVATEDVVLMLQQMGYDTGVDLARLIDAVDLAIELTGNCDGGNAINWLRRQREKGALQVAA